MTSSQPCNAASSDCYTTDCSKHVTEQFQIAERLLYAQDCTSDSLCHAEQIFLHLFNEHQHGPSAFALGCLFESAPGGIAQNLGKAVKYYDAAAKQNYEPAFYRLASVLRMHDSNPEVPKNPHLRIEMYHRAIDAGDRNALNSLAVLLSHGDESGGVKKDVRQAEELYRRAIDAGDTNALFNLALLLHKGDEAGGVKKDKRKAEALYRRAIDAGDTDALFNLGNLLLDGDEKHGVKKDARQAEVLYRRAVDAGHTLAVFNLANLLLYGDEAGGVRKDARQAELLYRRAIDAGHTEALNNLALLLRHGDEAGGVKKDTRQAEALFRRAIDAGKTNALYNLALLLHHGDKAGGVRKDARQAEALYRRAIDAGDTNALFNLGNLLLVGDEEDGVKKDARQTELLYRRAMGAGHNGALYNLANLLLHGDEVSGVKKDVRQAELLYRRAIDAGQPDALNDLAVLMRHGDEGGGVQKDARQAEALLWRAIDAGCTDALNNLALLLRHGDEAGGVKKDVRQAELLYRRAIDAGVTNALFNLGDLLHHGDEAGGVTKDARQAEALYRRAIDVGDTNALFNLGNLLLHGDEEDGVKKDARQAEVLYRHAIYGGHKGAINNLAFLLHHGDEAEGVKKDVRQAKELYRRAIDAGNTVALFNLGNLLRVGDEAGGVKKDARQAEALYRRAIDAGHTDALRILGNLLLHGDVADGVKKDTRQAEALYRRAIDAGDENALVDLANVLRNDAHLDDSFSKSIEVVQLLDRAVERGIIEAHAWRGLMFERGAAGVRIDTEAAVMSFRRGWEGGDLFCGYLLARSLLEDGAVDDQLIEAENILKFVKSKQTDCCALATHELAIFYERGRGQLDRNSSLASELYRSVMTNLSNGRVIVPFVSNLILKSGPRYQQVIEHVLETGEATPKKCLLLTLGGAARGKSSTVRSMKHMSFERSHKKTLMTDFYEFVASPGDGQFNGAFIKDIDFNDSSVQASIRRYKRGMGSITKLTKIAESRPQQLADSSAIVKRNALHPHVDVVEQIRRAMFASEYGPGFKRAAVTVWDMGGQDEYEMAHSLFVERANILLFVTNLARVENDEMRCSEVELLAYWINFSYMLRTDPKKVATFVVATHKNSCQGKYHAVVLQRLSIELRSALKESIWVTWFRNCKRGQIPDNFVSVENSISEHDRADSGLERLEKVIQKAADEIVAKRPAMQIRWLALIDKLDRLGENFYPRRRVLDICEGFPGFSSSLPEREIDILHGLRSLASMGKLVLFEMTEKKWHVFMSVERTVQAAGAIVSAFNDPEAPLTDAELQDLKNGTVDEQVLAEIWGNMSPEEKDVMRELLVSFDHLMELDGQALGKKHFAVPALLRCGALNLQWGSRKGDKQLYVITKFYDVIPSVLIGRLMAFLHRTVSSHAPPATLVRQNVALITVKACGQAFVEFDRRKNELMWIFLSPVPVLLAQMCFKNFEELLTDTCSRWRITSQHEAKADCPACSQSNCLSVKLDRSWINSNSSTAEESDRFPDMDIFCPHCQTQWHSSEVNWLRRNSDSDGDQSSPLASLLAVGRSKRYDVFISHAGPDKVNLAYPIYRSLERLGLRCFLDFKSLETGPRTAPAEMDEAMNDAKIGIFILSPEFGTRKWTMRELGTFLYRYRTEKEGSIILHPVFYKLTTADCYSFYESEVKGDGSHRWCGKYSAYLHDSKFVQQHLAENGSVSQLQSDLSGIRVHTGSIVDPPGHVKLSDTMLKENIIDSVINAAQKLKLL